MALSISIDSVLRPTRTLNTVVVCAKKDHRSSARSSWKKKLPKKKYSILRDDLGDISELYRDDAVVKDSYQLLKDSTGHINVYLEDGKLPEAEKLFNLMIKKRVQPNAYTYTTLMKGHLEAGNTERVSELFKEMEKKDIEPTLMSFNTAIRAYASTGDLDEAQSLFKKLKDIYGLSPDAYTYASMLQVCVTAKDLVTAKHLIDEMNSSGIKHNKLTLDTMIDVYAECCNEDNGKQYLKECREMIEDQKRKKIRIDEQTYNTLLKLCSRGSLTANSTKILKEMRANRVSPDVVSYSTVLDGISKDKNLSNERGSSLASRIVKEMKEDEVNANAASFTSLISVALRIEDLHRVERLFEQMKTLEIKPTVVTYGIMIKCYEKLRDPSVGYSYLKPCLELWRECKQAGMKLTAEGYINLLSACANVSNLVQASRVWKQIIADDIKPNAVLYNAMLNVCINAGDLDKAISHFNEMTAEGIAPNSVTYAIMIKAIEKLGDPKDGDDYLKSCLDILKECEEAGVELDVEGYISLLSACAKAGNLDQALQIWNKMIFDEIKLTASTHNAMVNVCINTGNLTKAVILFNEMKNADIAPNSVTYAIMIKAIEKLGDPKDGDVYLKSCLDLLVECEQSGVKLEIEGYISLLSACAKASNLDQALKIWNRMMKKKVKPSVSVFNAMISACLINDNEEKALDFFDQMKISKIKPDDVTYGNFVSYFVKKKDRTGAEKIHNEMKRHGVKSNRAISQMLRELTMSLTI